MTDEKSLTTFPTAMPGGDIVPYLSPKQRAALMDYVHRETGGAQGMIDWVKRDDRHRGQFYAMWAKGAARPMETSDEDKNRGRIEEMLARLDAGENATVIEAVRDDE